MVCDGVIGAARLKEAGLPAPVCYQDQDPLVEVFTSADSVAEREGLT